FFVELGTPYAAVLLCGLNGIETRARQRALEVALRLLRMALIRLLSMLYFDCGETFDPVTQVGTENNCATPAFTGPQRARLDSFIESGAAGRCDDASFGNAIGKRSGHVVSH